MGREKRFVDCRATVDDLRCGILIQEAEVRPRYEKLKKKLPEAMEKEKLGLLNYSQVNVIRTELQQLSTFLGQIPYVLKGLDLREQAEKQHREAARLSNELPVAPPALKKRGLWFFIKQFLRWFLK